MLTDPMGDFFSRIRNGAKARHETVRAPYSKLKEEVLKILKGEGFLLDYEVEEKAGKKSLAAHLKFHRNGEPVLESIRRLSKPGQRVYSRTPEHPRVRGGIGFQILSTSHGLMTDKDAIKKKLGGELLGEVY